MEINKASEQTSTWQKNGQEGGNFTGEVFTEELVKKPAGAVVRVLRVLFNPGARTFWHSHPEGQVLHVVAGRGGVQKEGETTRQIGPGDTVYAAPGEVHWHGAAPDSPMIHLAIAPNFTGQETQWRLPDAASGVKKEVSDEDYRRGFSQ